MQSLLEGLDRYLSIPYNPGGLFYILIKITFAGVPISTGILPQYE